MLSDLYRDPDKQFEYVLTLCKRNKQKLVQLSEAYNIIYHPKFQDVSELTFKIPLIIQDKYTHRHKENPHCKLIYTDYLILMETPNESVYFIIDNPSDNFGDSDYMEIHSSSLEAELSKRQLRQFVGTRMIYNPDMYFSYDQNTWTKYVSPINATGHSHIYVKSKDFTNVNEILADKDIVVSTVITDINGISFDIHTNTTSAPNFTEITLGKSGETGLDVLHTIEDNTTWRVGTVDILATRDYTNGSNHQKYRTFDVSEKTYLSFIRTEIESAFECICQFDSINKLINIFSVDSFNDVTLYISDENYLKTLKKDVKNDESYNRLYIYGKDNLITNSVNPTGQSYIETWQKQIDNGNISDIPNGTVTAINNYNALVDSKKGQFTDLLAQLGTQENLLADKQVELNTLTNEMKIIMDAIAVQMVANGSLTDLNNQKVAKQTAIDTKNAEINNVVAQIGLINSNIMTLQSLLDKKNNFTQAQLNEMSDLICEKVWQNTNYYEANSLFEAGNKALLSICEPTITSTLSIASFLNCTKCQHTWKNLKLGNVVIVNYKNYGEVQLRVIEYNHDSDGGGLDLVISNRNKKSDSIRYLTDSVSSANYTSKTLIINKNMWDTSKETTDWVEKFRNNVFSCEAQAVVGGRELDEVRIDERGIFVKNHLDSNCQLAILSGLLAITDDAWATCKTAIDKNGIASGVLVGKIVCSEKLSISNKANNCTIDETGFQLKDEKYALLVSAKGIVNCQNLPFCDSVDSDKALGIEFFVDENTNVISDVELKLSCQDFRSYAKSVIGGASNTTTVGQSSSVTTSSGGVHTHQVFHYNGLPSVLYEEDSNEFLGSDSTGNNYKIVLKKSLNESNGDIYTYGASDAHSHNFPHTHQFPHSHESSLQYGLYTTPRNVGNAGIIVNGNNIGNVSNDRSITNITQYITKGWNTITISSPGLNRYVGTVFLKVYMGA